MRAVAACASVFTMAAGLIVATPIAGAQETGGAARAAQSAYLEENGGITTANGDTAASIANDASFGKVVNITKNWVANSSTNGVPTKATGTFKDASAFAKNAWTISADVKITDDDTTASLAKKPAISVGTKDQAVNLLLATGQLGYGSTNGGASGKNAALSTKPSKNDWAAVSIVYSENASTGSIAAYIDGEQVLAPTDLGFKLSTAKGVTAHLGHGFNTNMALVGTYDSITVSGKAATMAEAKADTAARVRAKRNATTKDTTNKTALKASITKAQAIAKNGKAYTGHSTQLLDEALAQAIAVRDGSSYTQSQVDWQVRVLDAVVSGMETLDRNASRYSTVQVGKTWLDTNGAAIQAHGGGFLQQTDKDGKPIYYWVGEDKTHNSSNFNGISLYSSKDLVNWTFRNVILKADANASGLTDNKIERPKLVYNAKTHKYVLWGHWEAGDGYSSSQIAVATSDTVDGDYTFLGHWRPGADARHRNWRVQGGKAFFDGTNEAIADYSDTNVWSTGSRDFTVFVDDDATAYLLSAQDGSRMRIYKLNADYTDVAFNADGKPSMTYLLFDGGRREAPALSKVDGKYYLITSGQSGWYPNEGRYSYTTNLSDPKGWKLDANGKSPFAGIGNNSTFYSQPTNIMQINGSAGTTLVYMGDRWTPAALRESTYVWLPLTETGDAANPLAMSYNDGWSLDTATGKVRLPDVQLLSRGKAVKTSTDAAVSNKDGLKLEYANDGDYSTSFRGFKQDGSTVALPFTYTVDLGKAYELERADLSTRLVNGSETYYQYTIETSVDGKAWTKRVDQSKNILVGFKSDALNSVKARYVRLNVSKVAKANGNQSASWAVGIQEFEVYGKADNAGAAQDGTYLTAQAFKVAGKTPVNRVQLRWEAADGAKTYKVIRGEKADLSDAKEVASLDASQISWVDNLPVLERTYHWRVKALDASGKEISHTRVADAKTYTAIPDGMGSWNNETGGRTNGSHTVDGGIVVNGVRYKYDISGNSDKAAANGYVMREQKSTDNGKTWTVTGNVVNVSDQKGATDVNGNAVKDELSDYKLESVSTVWNKKRNKVVVWAHWERKAGYGTGAVMEADVTPGNLSTAHYGGLVFPNGYTSRDKGVFVDDDNTAYLISASNQKGEGVNRHILISKLNADWTQVVPVGANGYVAKLTANASREAPAMIKVNGWYYLFTSPNAGWLPSEGGYYASQNLGSGWTELRTVGEKSSYSTQQNSAGVYTGSEGANAVVSGNRWWKSDGTAGWRTAPITFDKDEVRSEYYRKVWTDPVTGLVLGERSGSVLSEGKKATINGKDASASVDGDYSTSATDSASTRWPATWQVDLGKAYPLTGLEISSYTMKGSEAWYPYTVYGSNDNKTFTKVLDKTTKPAAANKADYGFTDVTLTGTYRYVKIVFNGAYPQNNFNKAQGWYGVKFYEIKVLGDDGLTPPATGDSPVVTVNGPAALAVGETATPTAKVTPDSLADKSVTWSSSDVAVASVDAKTGKVTARKASAVPVTITATADAAGANGSHAKASFTVNVVPANLVYYIDAGTGTNGGADVKSPVFDAVRGGAAGKALLNKASDQSSANANAWGVVGAEGTDFTRRNGANGSTAVRDTGWLAKGDTISYRLPLKAGKYEIVSESARWNGTNRVFTPSATWTDKAGKQQTVRGADVQLNNAQRVYGNGTVAVTLDADAVVTFTLTKASGGTPTLDSLYVVKTGSVEPDKPASFEESLIEHLSFDGNADDSTANKLNGTVVGSGSSYVAGVSGKAGTALNLTGKQHVSLGTSTKLQPSSLTLSFWLKPNGDMGDGEQLVNWSKGAYNSDGWYLVSTKDKALQLSVGPATGQPYLVQVDVSRADFFKPGEWTHVVVTYDAASKAVTFYRDGVKVSSSVRYAIGQGGATGVLGSTSAEKGIGWNGSQYKVDSLNAALDEYRLYGLAATADQAKALYDQDKPKETVPSGTKVTSVTVLGRRSLRAGGSVKFAARVNPSDADDASVTWSSSDEKVATVDGSGRVRALRAGTVRIVATARDGSGVSGALSVTVAAADVANPVISGASNASLARGAAFDALAGVAARDDRDGDLSSHVLVSGSVDTDRAGSYTLTYSVADRAGNKATVTRTITVR